MAIAFDRVEKPLRQLRKSLRKLPASPAPDAVHKLRTRARQVEAIAAALPPAGEKLARRLLKSIKSLRKAAGRVRDMDVLAAHARTLPHEPHAEPLARLFDHLDRSRKVHAAALLETFDSQRKPAREHLRQYARQLENNSAFTVETEAQIGAAAAQLTADLNRWRPLTARNLHSFRLKVKELRAVLQLLESANQTFVSDLGIVKDKIGDWHDWQQLAKTAAEVLGTKQHRALLTVIRRACSQKLSEALASANALRARHLQRPPKKPPVSERSTPAAVTARRTPAV